MITRLEIENFKAIRKLSIDLGPLTVMVGPNDSGKSTILQALELLGRTCSRPIFDSGVPSVFDSPPAELTHDKRNRTMRFGVEGVIDGSTYQYKLAFDAGTYAVAAEQLYWQGTLDIDHGRAARTRLRELADAEPYAAIVRELSSFVVAIEPHQLTLPCALTATPQSNGFGLPGLIGGLLTAVNHAERDRYETALRRFSPNVTAIGVRPVNDKENELVFGLPDGKAVPAREVSTGLLMAAAYVALPHLPFARFLVEEPENGVHPRAMLLIADVLRDLARGGRQVVMTTHSPILLNYMDAEDVQVVTRRGGNVQVVPITKTAHFDDRLQDFDLGELWYAIGEDELVSNAS